MRTARVLGALSRTKSAAARSYSTEPALQKLWIFGEICEECTALILCWSTAHHEQCLADTTLRDDELSPGAMLTEKEKVEIARQLSRLHVDICEAGFPIASQGDFDAVTQGACCGPT